MTYHYTPARMAKTKRTDRYEVIAKIQSNCKSQTLLVEVQSHTITLGNCFSVSTKVWHIPIPYSPSIPFLIYQKRRRYSNLPKHIHRNINCSFIQNSSKVKNPNVCPSTHTPQKNNSVISIQIAIGGWGEATAWHHRDDGSQLYETLYGEYRSADWFLLVGERLEEEYKGVCQMAGNVLYLDLHGRYMCVCILQQKFMDMTNLW